MIVTKYYKLTDNLILQVSALTKNIVMYLINLNVNGVVKHVFSDDFYNTMKMAIRNDFFNEMDNQNFYDFYDKILTDFNEYHK